MKATHKQEVGAVTETVIVEFDEFNDNVADLLAFLDFPLRREISSDIKEPILVKKKEAKQ